MSVENEPENSGQLPPSLRGEEVEIKRENPQGRRPSKDDLARALVEYHGLPLELAQALVNGEPVTY